VPNTRPPISELFSAIRESNVIESTCDYSFDPLQHHKKLIELNEKSGDLVHPMLINIDIDTAGDSHRGSTVRHVTPPFDKSVDPKVKRLKTRRLLNRKKNIPANNWRFNDVEFDKLNSLYHFTVEGCRDPSGLNRHGTMSYYSELNSLLDNDVSGESIYCNPPWSLAVACVQHLRACHAKASMDTKAVIVLPNWPVYKATTKELKLLRQIPI
jgi:hypothetical protein